MLPYSNTIDPLTAIESNDTLQSQSPTRVQFHPNVNDNSSSPPTSLKMKRLDSRLSNFSYNSSSNLVTHDSVEEVGEGFWVGLWRWPSRARRKTPPSKPFDLEKRRDGDALPEDQSGILGSGEARKAWHTGWRVIVLGSWFNILLVLIPASWVLDITLDDSSAIVFIFCILSMIPLVKLHDLATSDLARRIGGSKAGLLNASMSNIVELVFAISALRKCELRVVQSSLVGSMLSKQLLVLGMCFFAGGIRFTEQDFGATATHIHSSLLIISVSALLLPAAYHFTWVDIHSNTVATQKVDLLKMSHGVSIILLVIYASYLVFQLYSHKHLYKDSKTCSARHKPSTLSFARGDFCFPQNMRTLSKLSLTQPGPHNKHKSTSTDTSWLASNETPRSSADAEVRVSDDCRKVHSRKPYSASPVGSSIDVTTRLEERNSSGSSANTMVDEKDTGTVASRGAVPAPELDPTVKLVQAFYTSGFDNVGEDGCDGGSGSGIERTEWRQFEPAGPRLGDGDSMFRQEESPEPEQPERHAVKEPRLSWVMTLVLLTSITVMVAVNADELVDSMDSIESISKTWIALILLPTVSCIAECVTAVNVSVKDQLSLSISVAVGSTVQTALFVIPFMVILGWILDKPLALLFDPFESVVLYISVHTMSSVVQDGKSNWLEGVILVCLYGIIAVAFWFYPGSNFSYTLAACPA
ncbi:hypothetical protein JAAARDRAFT_210152 [Jaapia argillacea MUCL 33604]|uniref:Sodium/calcium exchanger membrane region domain-containing protein n=1 Tax=Jaapia argillacea MUCL 33604 TaxID=933084 RepID=A0A067PE63_9AGAM|nr:hypothetical protein JAAARDRAFT_210152 [Jaapia argillacea MUCL 33604]